MKNIKNFKLFTESTIKTLKNFCNQYGLTSDKLGDELGLDPSSKEFGKAVIDNDYLWIEDYSVWVPENLDKYSEEDKKIIDGVKHLKPISIKEDFEFSEDERQAATGKKYCFSSSELERFLYKAINAYDESDLLSWAKTYIKNNA